MLRRTFVVAAPAVLFVKAAPKSGSGLLNGRDLAGWVPQEGKPSAWFTTTAVKGEEKRLVAAPVPGGIIVNGTGRTANLVTASKHGDCELHVEFMVPEGSNSGVYLHGLYEVQVFDSWGHQELKTSDCGAVYHRWINEKPVGGSAPRVNASKKPGEWQTFDITFRAPRFKDGKKVENARFVRVLHNGVEIQKNVEVDGGTRSHMRIAEAAQNPLMLQGDHGPVAYRSIVMIERKNERT